MCTLAVMLVARKLSQTTFSKFPQTYYATLNVDGLVYCNAKKHKTRVATRSNNSYWNSTVILVRSLVSVAATAVRRTCVNSTKFKHARIDLTDCVRRVLFIQSRCSCGKPWHANQRQHQHPGRRLHHRVLLHGRCRRNTHEGTPPLCWVIQRLNNRSFRRHVIGMK